MTMPHSSDKLEEKNQLLEELDESYDLPGYAQARLMLRCLYFLLKRS